MSSTWGARGTDGFTLPVALKVFSPEPYADANGYEEDMGRIARVAARAALIQHDNLLDVHNFVVQDGLRVMEMEWVDGYDLREVLTPGLLNRTRQRVSPEQQDYVNRVIITAGPAQPRLKPGWRSWCCASAWRAWRRCIGKALSTAT